MRKLKELLFLAVMIVMAASCGSDTSVNLGQSENAYGACVYRTLRWFQCNPQQCTLGFDDRQLVVNHGVWYVGHQYKICPDGSVTP